MKAIELLLVSQLGNYRTKASKLTRQRTPWSRQGALVSLPELFGELNPLRS
jgi:hypothetical protein